MDALKHASTMLSELRTSLLTPKSYYELCIFKLYVWNYYCANVKHIRGPTLGILFDMI